jgi:hypothetical protein
MALLSRSEFADFCGKNIKSVNVYIGRGKIIPSGKFIDTKIPDNIIQMQKWGVDPNGDISKIESPPTPAPEKKSPAPALKKAKATKVLKKNKEAPDYSKRKIIDPEDSVPDYSRVLESSGLDTQKKQAEIIKIKETTLNTQLRNAKLRGESIPVNMVSDVISALGSGFQTAYKNGADSFMLELSHKHKLAPSVVSDLKVKLIELINNSHKRAISIAKKELKNVISQTKSVENNSDLEE